MRSRLVELNREKKSGVGLEMECVRVGDNRVELLAEIEAALDRMLRPVLQVLGLFERFGHLGGRGQLQLERLLGDIV